VRIFEFPFAVQCWTYRKYTFTETLDKVKALGLRCLEAYPGQPLGGDWPGLRFDHNLEDSVLAGIRSRLEDLGLSLVGYGVVGFENAEAEMRKVFEFARKMGIPVIMTEPAYDDLSLIERMVKEFNIRVAIHNHPPPTKYARPETVLRAVRDLDPRIGTCADTGHWLRTGVDPVAALKMLEGRIRNVHLKDLDRAGERSALDVPFGSGKAGIRAILEELTRQNYTGYLTIEHEHPDEALNPEPAVRKGLEFVRGITYYRGYQRILGHSRGVFNKHGWNHYGPGYFELDPETGVIKSQGGMGLFWYARRTYRDFVLELDFKCSREDTNSARIPTRAFSSGCPGFPRATIISTIHSRSRSTTMRPGFTPPEPPTTPKPRPPRPPVRSGNGTISKSPRSAAA
jgi:sugar phosphate isomerase/epimerase